MARGGLSATRAIEILDFLTSRGTTAYTLSEIAKQLDVNVASCHAILLSLTKTGHLSRHPKHKTYRLGPALVAIGDIARRNHERIADAEAAAAVLSKAEGLEVLLTMRAGDSILALAHYQIDRLSRSWLHTGQRLPLQAPFGATFLAWESEEDAARWIARGFHGEVEAGRIDELKTLLGLVRRRGYQIVLQPGDDIDFAARTRTWEPVQYLRKAAERMQQFHDNFNILAMDPLKDSARDEYAVDFITAPIFDIENKALYAMTLYNFDEKISKQDMKRYVVKLVGACDSLSG